MRKIIVYIAASADGFIARPDGDVAWLDRPDAAGDYGMKAFYKTIDTVVMGRKTWSVGKRLGQASFPGVTNYVFSRTPRKSALVKIVGAQSDPSRSGCGGPRARTSGSWAALSSSPDFSTRPRSTSSSST